MLLARRQRNMQFVVADLAGAQYWRRASPAVAQKLRPPSEPRDGTEALEAANPIGNKRLDKPQRSVAIPVRNNSLPTSSSKFGRATSRRTNMKYILSRGASLSQGHPDGAEALRVIGCPLLRSQGPRDGAEAL